MGVHDGHRDRLKESFLEHGLDSMNDINALELLLFFAIPRRDTNELAHRLLEHFGDLAAVFEASEQELCEVEGIGRNTAALLLLVPQVFKKAQVSRAKEQTIIRNSRDAGAYLKPRFLLERDEVLLMLCLDSKRAVISCCEMGRGVVNALEANVRRMVEYALKVKASSVIIAHNHPNGFATPSREDDTFTKALYLALRAVGIPLEDHILVADGTCISFADSGLLQLYRY